VKTVLWSFGTAVLLGGLVAGFVALTLPVSDELVLDLYLLFLGAVTLLALVRTTRVAHPGSGGSPFENALRPSQPRSHRPPELVRLEHRLALAATTAFDVHYRLRPVVREIAAARLWARHAVDLESEPERAASLLGGEVWELVRPDRPPPPEPFGQGLGLAGIEAVAAELEAT
jgi:hypothetical protein